MRWLQCLDPTGAHESVLASQHGFDFWCYVLRITGRQVNVALWIELVENKGSQIQLARWLTDLSWQLDVGC